MTTAATLIAAIGRIDELRLHLVGYLDLDPRSRSGLWAVQLATSQARLRKLRQLELAVGVAKRSNQRGVTTGHARHPAECATERRAALSVEERYRAAVADWKFQRPPSPIT